MNIWSCWLQGRDEAPSHVKKIFDLWEQMNLGHKFVVVERKEVDQIINKLGVKQYKMTPQVKTNLARTYLLYKHGGVWVDSTLLPTKPIDDWLPEKMKAGFFAFRSSGSPELVLQNWFLSSEKNNPLMKGWLDIYSDYFSSIRYYPTVKRALYHRKLFDFYRYKQAVQKKDWMFFSDPEKGRDCSVYPYAIHNYNLKYLLDSKPEFKRLWSNVPALYNTLPSLIGREAADVDTPIDTFLKICLELLPTSPVHKLNHRDARFDKLIDLATQEGLLKF